MRDNERDALVARIRMHARDCVSAADIDTDTVLSTTQIDDMADAFNQAAEALAAPAASVDVSDMPSELRWKLDNFPRVTCVFTMSNDEYQWFRKLIDSAGGANGMRDAYEGAREDLLDWKGRAQRAERTLRGLGYTGIDASEAPQPAEGDGAVTLESAPIGTQAPAIGGGHWTRVEHGWQWCTGAVFPRPGGDWDGKLVLPKATRPSAAAAVDDAMVDRAIRAFENEPASHTDDDWDRRCMRAALTAALADGEAASA